jgi:hypothetical protein
MNKIPKSRLTPILIMAIILVIDVIVIVRDFLTNNISTALCLILLGAVLGYRCVISLLQLRKEYK